MAEKLNLLILLNITNDWRKSQKKYFQEKVIAKNVTESIKASKHSIIKTTYLLSYLYLPLSSERKPFSFNTLILLLKTFKLLFT